MSAFDPKRTQRPYFSMLIWTRYDRSAWAPGATMRRRSKAGDDEGLNAAFALLLDFVPRTQ